MSILKIDLKDDYTPGEALTILQYYSNVMYESAPWNYSSPKTLTTMLKACHTHYRSVNGIDLKMDQALFDNSNPTEKRQRVANPNSAEAVSKKNKTKEKAHKGPSKERSSGDPVT